MVLSDHVGEEGDAFAPVEAGAEAVVKPEGVADAFHPEFGAGGGEDEL